jgi:predicted nucleotide-binding protein
MVDRLSSEVSASKIIDRINTLASQYGTNEFKVDWIKGGYGRYLWNKRETDVIDFDTGLKYLIRQGNLTLVDQNRFRLNFFNNNEKINRREENQLDNEVKLKIDKSNVFIVHGHDDLARIEVARFIEKIGLSPIILHEQASKGKTIIEKIEEYSNVGFGIVLYTPCDIGGKNDDRGDLQSRARQNVVFEHGFLIGKIGRENVVALVKGSIETPNDISGIVYINMDQFNGWQMALIKELINSGYNLDITSLYS